MIYETKGLSLEQVDELYGKVPTAWQSTSFVPTVNFQEIQEAGITGAEARRMTLTEVEGIAIRRKSSVVYQEKERSQVTEKV